MKKITVIISIISLILGSCGEKNTENNKTDNSQKVKKQTDLLSSDIIRSGQADGNRFFVTTKGDTLFNGKTFYNTHEFKDGYCVVSQKVNGEILNGVIDIKGKEVIPITYSEKINDYNNGYFRIYRKNSGYGYIDTTGKIVVEPKYEKVGSIWDNKSIVRNQHFKWGMIDFKENTILPFEYDFIGIWRDNLAVVEKNKKYGYIDKNGDIVIDLQYALALPFEHNLALVKKGNKIGFIDTTNTVVIDFIYDDYKTIVDVYEDDISLSGYSQTNKRFSMKEGYIVLKKDGKWGYINVKGNVVIPFEYDNIGIPGKGSDRVSIVKNGKKGIYSINDKKESIFNDN